MKVKEFLREFSLTLSFIAGMVVFLNFPHVSTLVIFISIVMMIFGLSMLISPRKSPKVFGILELITLFMGQKKHGNWADKLIRLVGAGLFMSGLIFLIFVYNRTYKFTNDSYIVFSALIFFVAIATAENYIISSYKKKKMKRH